MRVITNLQWPDALFRRADRLFGREVRHIVGFNVEWTKNYRIKNGSRPFCYSLVTFALPSEVTPLLDLAQYFGFKSVYVDQEDEEQELIDRANRDLVSIAETGQLLTGHQLTSDLSVLKAASRHPVEGIEEALESWHLRTMCEHPAVFDTRYDINHLVTGTSRRLVDVCVELELDVYQPEINGSMTRVHRRFLETGEELQREKLIVLNLRHSLSACLVALLALGLAERQPVDVNLLLAEELWDQIDYIADGTMRALLDAARARDA